MNFCSTQVHVQHAYPAYLFGACLWTLRRDWALPVEHGLAVASPAIPSTPRGELEHSLNAQAQTGVGIFGHEHDLEGEGWGRNMQ
jgi:hypothetical protein